MEYITIFGSARFDEHSPYYKAAFNLASKLSKAGYGIVTGGSGGIMEAANKGAFLSGGVSVGINVILPFEQKTNPYCTTSKLISNLPDRKKELISMSDIFIIMPGGFGTLDELFEVLTEAQTGVRKHKIIFCCSDFWNPLIDFFKNTLLPNGAINDHSFTTFTVLDDFDEILEYIHN
ncbi:putative lysine decarboxylase family protein [Campylobacter iguaniorum]|uniref:Cytokinin riboside 5'-monophosphate phosphoribohydrolase n=1 Tax=Campylobacter iguaniorum TaxID=1244531 RepID=A0A076F9S9_9BACT|nr:TIGR00730 family Rossman fold protein [Campylobacter iguaniorum]AII14252.1 putative lysine decarboxylase family protein [Campylobacter iguaniorum]ALV23990.1 putative lysine decarboxylase family protein [Campylobacter iguaniorum]